MHSRLFGVWRVAFLVFAIMFCDLVSGIPAMYAAEDQRVQPFQWYLEADVIDYANPPRIEMIVPQNRVAVIEWVSFRASNVQCKLAGVLLQTTLKDLNALHHVVGVTDMGPSQVGRVFGLSQKIRAYSGAGTTVILTIIAESTPNPSCPGDGLDFTVTGHYAKP
jgi:hypothetical protein